MNTYKRHRFPPDIISYAVWLYYLFDLRRVVTAIAILKICWLKEELLLAEMRSDYGTQSTRCAHGAGSVAVSNLFNLGRHLITAEHYRDLRVSAFKEWGRAVA